MERNEPPTLTPWLDLVATVGGDFKTPEQPHEHCGVWLNASDWAKAQHLMLDHLNAVALVSVRRRYAKDLSRTLNSRRHTELADTDPTLVERVRVVAGIEAHGNSDGRTHTVYHTDGAQISGTRRELMAATGLAPDRLKDLLGGRRRLVKGWTMTLAEARRGRLPPGPKRKVAPEPQAMDWEDFGAPLF